LRLSDNIEIIDMISNFLEAEENLYLKIFDWTPTLYNTTV
jgi:hypothetical protein